MIKNKRIGLSLSGGGYRAAAFHLGTLKKLHELGILEKIDVLSTVSGGSITGAFYCLNKHDFGQFEKSLKEQLKNSITRKLKYIIWISFTVIVIISTTLLFTNFSWILAPMALISMYFIWKYQFTLFPVSKYIIRKYDELFFHKLKLKDLPEYPVLAINSTNIETGRLWTFSKNKMGDSSYSFPEDGKPAIGFLNKEFPISKAVAASSCVPFAFTPIPIDKQFFSSKKDADRANPRLVDGGVYDNQGIHKITQKGSSYECDIVITSDAGNLFPFRHNFSNIITLLIRTSDIFMHRTKNVQMIQNLYLNKEIYNKEITYFSLGWNIENCIEGFITNLLNDRIVDSVVEALEIPKLMIEAKERDQLREYVKERIRYSQILPKLPTRQEIKIARSVETDLHSLSKEQIDCLMKQSMVLTELQLKLYCPSLFQDK